MSAFDIPSSLVGCVVGACVAAAVAIVFIRITIHGIALYLVGRFPVSELRSRYTLGDTPVRSDIVGLEAESNIRLEELSGILVLVLLLSYDPSFLYTSGAVSPDDGERYRSKSISRRVVDQIFIARVPRFLVTLIGRSKLETLVAVRFEDTFSKLDIFTIFINLLRVSVGATSTKAGQTGEDIRSRAQQLFDKPLGKLDLDEVMCLLGLTASFAETPSAASPLGERRVVGDIVEDLFSLSVVVWGWRVLEEFTTLEVVDALAVMQRYSEITTATLTPTIRLAIEIRMALYLLRVQRLALQEPIIGRDSLLAHS